MFRVVTVSREYGSGGSEIARRVADYLGWDLFDDDLMLRVAFRAEVDVSVVRRYDERVDSWWRRMNRAGLWSAAIASGITAADALLFDADAMARITHELIQEVACEGDCVIVGRGAQCVLRNFPHAFHVFIYGPDSERVARIQQRAEEEGRDAAELIRTTDRARAAYHRRHFGCDWKDPDLYQTIMSSEFGIENAAGMIANAVVDAELAALARLSGV